MAVSLYAHGTAVIEVGKYGMNLEEAKAAFLTTCQEFSLQPKIKEKKGGLIFVFKADYDSLGEFLNEVAEVEDLHGDAPSTYSMKEEVVPEGQYIKTGTYND